MRNWVRCFLLHMQENNEKFGACKSIHTTPRWNGETRGHKEWRTKQKFIGGTYWVGRVHACLRFNGKYETTAHVCPSPEKLMPKFSFHSHNNSPKIYPQSAAYEFHFTHAPPQRLLHPSGASCEQSLLLLQSIVNLYASHFIVHLVRHETKTMFTLTFCTFRPFGWRAPAILIHVWVRKLTNDLALTLRSNFEFICEQIYPTQPTYGEEAMSRMLQIDLKHTNSCIYPPK